jgi:outer membrane receptor protein involved in Fe transport
VSQRLTVSNSPVFLDPIHLKSNETHLDAVVVTAKKKTIEKVQGGFVFNATTSIAQVGGTATDLLKNIPTISVDAEGAITLRGKKPLILINGKNSSITNIDQIAASSIENIEVINNPTAKYDANAESGIINIKLKKNNQRGTNGAFVLGTGFGDKGRVNSSVILNHKVGKWNFGLGYDNRFAGRTKKINSTRTNYFIPDEYLLTQNRDDKRLEQLQNLKFNIDFSPNENNSFSFEAIGNMEGQDNDETLYSLINTNTLAFYSNAKRHSLELERSKVAELAFNYERKFTDERKSLTASLTSSFNKDRENTDIDTYNYDVNYLPIGAAFWQKTHNYENENISNAKIDYAFPVAKNTTIETGYKGTFRFFNSDFQTADQINTIYVVNAVSSNGFQFNEQINAVYGMLNSFTGNGDSPKWKYNLGLRAEQISNNGKTTNQNTDFSNYYLKLFPSGSVQYNLSSEESLKIGYSKRINLPELDQLNPFMDITDALNPHSGNPYLKPEIIHIVELGYAKDWKGYSFSATSFYRNAQNTIKQYSELQSNGAVLISPKNFGETITYGVESIFSFRPVFFYDANFSMTAFQQNINGANLAQDVVSKAFNWYGKWINNFVPWQGGKLQLIGSYNSKLATAQGNRIAVYSMDLGFQQKISKSNSRLGLALQMYSIP